jgi:hypothetical protein
MSKESSYQKLKRESAEKIAELTADIVALVDDVDSVKSTMVGFKWRLRLDMEKAIWKGDTGRPNENTLTIFLPKKQFDAYRKLTK